jgi:hypothetical protein
MARSVGIKKIHAGSRYPTNEKKLTSPDVRSREYTSTRRGDFSLVLLRLERSDVNDHIVDVFVGRSGHEPDRAS